MSNLSIRRLAAALSVTTVLLSGCGSSRDAALSEKLARAERAANRAEAAQAEAEQAAKSANAKLEQINAVTAGETTPIEDAEDREEAVDTAGAEIGAQDPA